MVWDLAPSSWILFLFSGTYSSLPRLTDSRERARGPRNVASQQFYLILRLWSHDNGLDVTWSKQGDDSKFSVLRLLVESSGIIRGQLTVVLSSLDSRATDSGAETTLQVACLPRRSLSRWGLNKDEIKKSQLQLGKIKSGKLDGCKMVVHRL